MNYDLLPTIIQVCEELKLFTKINFTEENAILEIINIEKPEETVIYTSPMKELSLKGANAIQALGGVQTYQRRYLYMCAFDIIENDMFDGSNLEEEPAKATKKTIKKMNDLIGKYATTTNADANKLKEMFLKKVGATTEGELTDEQAKKIIKAVESKL